MNKIRTILFLLLIIFTVSSCKTIEKKTDEIVKKENQKLSKFIGKSSNELKISMGNPDEDFKNENGLTIFIYKTKKYGIPCERSFEIDSEQVIIGFNSKGCF
tara:strand:+ start:240 stop:545 length:306 start_codon:yes stop_codon:yes gene_type:complete